MTDTIEESVGNFDSLGLLGPTPETPTDIEFNAE